MLVRHGDAVKAALDRDSERWLTAHGRATTRSVAAKLASLVPVATVWTSPLVRAVQTAEIVASGVASVAEVCVCRELATGDVRALRARVHGFAGAWPLCLVGHEPTLSALVASFFALQPDAPLWPGFGRADVCCLGVEDGAGRFCWALRAKDLAVLTDLTVLHG